MSAQETIVVTGASGQLGQLVLEFLSTSGAQRVIATTRTPEKLESYSKRGIDVRAADFKNPTTLVNAFRGATRMLMISTGDVGARVADQKNAVEAAKTAGVQHVLYTSWPNPDTSVSPVAPDHAATERDIKASGLKYTFLRNYPYAENLLYSLPSAMQTGTLYGSAGDAKVAYVTRRDCAAAAAAALVSGELYENAILDISGPKAHSYADIARMAQSITGRKVSYQDLPPEAHQQALVKAGFPAPFAGFFVAFDQALGRGEASRVTDCVQKLTGRAPLDLMEFLKTQLSSAGAAS